jgi:NAD(P)-dependent dehydrogenase (short-subunit alcohol dehydrogenase family)
LEIILNHFHIAIVTGSSRGIGRDTVIRIARHGVSSINTYNSRADEADKVVAAVREAGANAVAVQLDVSQPATFDVFVDRGQSRIMR